VFIAGNAVDWGLCLACALGLALGSFFGTRYGLRKGEEWMRTLVLLVIFASALKLIFFP
jgi:uncharacterized membrane protein YfcA